MHSVTNRHKASKKKFDCLIRLPSNRPMTVMKNQEFWNEGTLTFPLITKSINSIHFKCEAIHHACAYFCNALHVVKGSADVLENN